MIGALQVNGEKPEGHSDQMLIKVESTDGGKVSVLD